MNATLFPVAVVEKVFAPRPGGGFALKALVPVHYQLLDYSQGAMRVFDVDDTGTPLPTSHEVTPERYIVHRSDLMPAPDNWGGAMRSILFWWLLRTMSRQWWADLLERFGVPFLKGKYSDEKGKSTLERAFRLAVRLGAIVVSKNTEVEVVQAASGDASNSHERFITICNQEISKLVVGQTLSSAPSPTGELGGGTANLQGEVRDDIRKADAKSLAATLRGQLFDQLLAINGRPGRAPKILFGSESAREQAATLTVIGKLRAAGLEPDDDALDTLSERIGFGIRRAAAPQSPMLPFSASPLGFGGAAPVPSPVPLTAGDAVDDRPAASSAADLLRAFAADLAPLKDVIAASASPEDCVRRVEEWVSRHNPSNAADVIEKALYVYSMAGARSARPVSKRAALAASPDEIVCLLSADRVPAGNGYGGQFTGDTNPPSGGIPETNLARRQRECKEALEAYKASTDHPSVDDITSGRIGIDEALRKGFEATFGGQKVIFFTQVLADHYQKRGEDARLGMIKHVLGVRSNMFPVNHPGEQIGLVERPTSRNAGNRHVVTVDRATGIAVNVMRCSDAYIKREYK